MRKLFILLLAAGNLSADVPAAQFRGYDAFNVTLQNRLFLPRSGFTFGKYIGSEALGVILGRYVGDGNEMTFVNGRPNATNMALWHVGIMALSRDFAKVCTHQSSFAETTIQPELLQALTRVCTWPRSGARKDSVLAKLWLAVMAYEAPASEYAAWKNFFLSAQFSNAPASQVVEGMFSTILMNPYFLLRN